MIEFTQYATQFQGFRGRLTGLPSWARFVVAVFAIPGAVLAALSFLGFLVSILTLLILTVPVYSLLRRLTNYQLGPASIPEMQVPRSAGVKRVESTIVE